MLSTLRRVESLLCAHDFVSSQRFDGSYDYADFEYVVIQCDSIIARCWTDRIVDKRNDVTDVTLLLYLRDASRRFICDEKPSSVDSELFFNAFLSFGVRLFDLNHDVIKDDRLSQYFDGEISDILSLDEVALAAVYRGNSVSRDSDRVRRFELYRKFIFELLPRSLGVNTGEVLFPVLCSWAGEMLPSVSAPFFINSFYSALASYVKRRFHDFEMDLPMMQDVGPLQFMEGVYGLYGVVCSALGPWIFLESIIQSRDSKSVFVDQALRLVMSLSERCILNGYDECKWDWVDVRSQRALLKCICEKADERVCKKYGFIDRIKFIASLAGFVSKLFQFVGMRASDVGLSGFDDDSHVLIDARSLDEVGKWALGSAESIIIRSRVPGRLTVYMMSMRIVEDIRTSRKQGKTQTPSKEISVMCENCLYVINDFRFEINKNNFISAVISFALKRLNIQGYDISQIELMGIGRLQAVDGISYYYDILDWALSANGSNPR